MERNNNRRADKPAETILSPEARTTVDEAASLDEQIAALEARRDEMNAEAARAEAWGTNDPIMTFDAEGNHADFNDYLKMRTESENAVEEEATFEDVDLKSLSLMQLVGEGRKMNELGDIVGKDDVLNMVHRQLVKRAAAEDWTDKELTFQADRFKALIDADPVAKTVATPAVEAEKPADISDALKFGMENGLIDETFLNAINAENGVATVDVAAPDAEPEVEAPVVEAEPIKRTADGQQIFTPEETDEIFRAAKEASEARKSIVIEPIGMPTMPDMTGVDMEEPTPAGAEAEPAEENVSDDIFNTQEASSDAADKDSAWSEFAKSPVGFVSSRLAKLAGRFKKKGREQRTESEEDHENRKSATRRTLGAVAVVGGGLALLAGVGIAANHSLNESRSDHSGDKPASTPQSEENQSGDILNDLNPLLGNDQETGQADAGRSAEPIMYDPSTMPETLPVNVEAGNVAPGGGWYEVMDGLGIPDSERAALLNKVGPELASQGYAYADNGEYRIVSPGQLPTSVLELIQNNR